MQKENRYSIGQKARNLEILRLNKISIPKTYILKPFTDIQHVKNLNLNKNLEYIIRPSVIGEDGYEKSMAGIFHSIGPITYYESMKILRKSKAELQKAFNINEEILGSIILQKFIRGDTYGVFFSKHPENILFKGRVHLGTEYNTITQGYYQENSQKIELHKKLQLKNLSKKIENIFKYPQDIEFVIQKGKVIILQTRPITTGTNFFPEYHNIKNSIGLYKKIDNDEFGKTPYFASSFLSALYNIHIIEGAIFAKKKYINHPPLKLKSFLKKYKTYLQIKTLHLLGEKILFFQTYSKQALHEIYSNYNYSFDVYTRSNIKTKFPVHGNIKTKLLIKREILKNIAHQELETIKLDLLKVNHYGKDISFLTYQEFTNNDKNQNTKVIKQRKLYKENTCDTRAYFIFYGNIFTKYHKFFTSSPDKIWIYKGEMQGEKQPLQNITRNTDKKYIAIVDHISDDILSYIDVLGGAIISSGSELSHNAIILREYKIPSYIKNQKR